MYIRNKKKIRVLFITEGNEETPSTRARVLQYLPLLNELKVDFKVELFNGENIFKRLLFYIKIFYYGIFQSISILFIQKRLIPQSLFYLLKRLFLRIIYDFDDSVYAFRGGYRTESRLVYILKNVNRIIAGNQELKSYAAQYNNNVEILCTPVNTNILKPDYLKHSSKFNNEWKVVIGWIGTSPNFIYLRMVEKALREVYKKYREKVEIRVVCSSNFKLNGISIKNQKWSKDKENEYLNDFDIGIMPLENTLIARGKCGFKLLQYMAVGIPVVASPVGINCILVKDGVNGYLCNSEEEWVEKLSILIENKNLRRKMGMEGRKIVEKEYSLKVNLPKMVEILRQVVNS